MFGWILFLRHPQRYFFFRQMRRKQFLSMEEIDTMSQQSLFKILKYASEHVPYYKNFVRQNNIKISSDDPVGILKSFPILTKTTLRDNFEDLSSDEFTGKYTNNTSGGSTGVPVVFKQSIEYNEHVMAAKLFFNSWVIGDKKGKVIKLWGAERDILGNGIGLNHKISNWLNQIILLNSFRMGDKEMEKYLKIINQTKPVLIITYVQSIFELAKYAQKRRIAVHKPKGIITSAGTLYPQMKEIISNVFGCPVFNRYGSREVGDVACSCEKDRGLHLNSFNHYVEILNDKYEPCQAGEAGNIYVTLLTNFCMPLIRYEIGDIAVPLNSRQCSCGRGLPLIKKVAGRTVNMFVSSSGQLIDGEFFTHLFYFKNWVKQFQVIQKSINSIVINIVADDVPDKRDMQEIESGILKVMGADCKIEWEYFQSINPSPSGKHLYTISEVIR